MFVDIQSYLKEVLGSVGPLRRWDGARGLPFHLVDRYEFAELVLFDVPCVLMIAEGGLDGEVDIRRHLDMVARHAGSGALAVYVAPGLASYERRRLIAQGVPFIVPGNQMFLPPLGLDLREYFRALPDANRQAFSPAAQALLFSALLGDWEDEIHPARLNRGFDYTAMTLSRATRELATAELATVVSVGREKWLRFTGGPGEVWQRAKAWVRSPVRMSVWAIPEESDVQDAPLAGLSALAASSALADPLYPERAISSDGWKAVKGKVLRPLPLPEPGAVRWQVWRYDPQPLAIGRLVDPLSLWAALHEDPDERVQQALEEMEAALPW
jgi:hypothetical protein